VHARVGTKSLEHTLDVRAQLVMPRRVSQDRGAGSLHPSGIVHVRLRRALRAELWMRIPHAVEQDEHHADTVAIGDLEELLDAPDERCRILLPEKIVQKDAHAVEAEAGCPSQLPVDRGRVERIGLPHLELVDGGARDEVGADQPTLLFLPRGGAFGRPPSLGVRLERRQRHDHDQ
jgi:hypothetical protein